MFRKRQKKNYPEGTFIPTKARICAIIQLCLAFSMILWKLSEPFAGDLFTIKSNLLLYNDVMGIHPSNESTLSNDLQEHSRLHANYFSLLSPENQKKIQSGRQKNIEALQDTFFEKLTKSVKIIFKEIPPFEQAWLILSVLISIMLLKRIEGAAEVIWLLPLLAALYGIDNRWYGQRELLRPDAHLFPSEKILVNDYLKKPLSEDIFSQQSELKQAWELYLVKEWTDGPQDGLDFESLIKEGNFKFNTARLLTIIEKKPDAINKNKKHFYLEPIWLLALYFFWNILFACIGFSQGFKQIPQTKLS